MAHITTTDGIRLYYEEAGSGDPIVFVHEFAGDYRSYETQLRFFARRYRCVAFNARGYPPSDVPEDWQRYSQDRARDDIRDVLDGLGIAQGDMARAHIVGISMGGFATLHFGFAYPERARSLVVAAQQTALSCLQIEERNTNPVQRAGCRSPHAVIEHQPSAGRLDEGR